MSDSFFLRWIGPGSLGGVHLGLWLKLLSQNGWAIAPRYLARAAFITGVATMNSVGRGVERVRFGRAINRAVIHPPLFVLGAWRSGTTHLFNLLCQDDRFAFPTTFQVTNPHTCLGTEEWLAPIHQRFYPATRQIDNMKMGVREPWEDEFAICAMSGLSPLLSWVFPKNYRLYDKYIDFSEVSAAGVDCWKQALLQFARKLSLKYDKPLVLKSPFHTARVRLLLEAFPQARFVYIHRHPHEVYASNLNLVRRAVAFVSLQRFDIDELSDRMISTYKLLTETYLGQRSMIPRGRLVEIGFQDLEHSPVPTLRHIYEQLDLPAFDVAEPAIQRYLATLADYQKNVYPQIDAKTKSHLAREWKRSFEAWGYSE
ncbi:MAG TPA: sulfotransferase [Pirellulales bacterium]